MKTLERGGFSRADAVLRDACGASFTGAVARIEHRGRLCFERAYGVTRSDERAAPVYVDSAFDLASLTKLFTATLCLQAVGEGLLRLDESLARWIGEWRGRPHEAITLRMLLAHDSGMNSGADYRQLLGENVLAYAITRDLVASPGECVIYSDLGFIVLGALLERLYGRSLASLVPRAIFRPPGARRAAIPATEEDEWRGRVQGFVHDEKAYLMGGIAGHAGLFGTAADVAWIAGEYLAPAAGRPGSVLSPQIAGEAVREQAFDPVLRRGLGWALKTSYENSCGRWFSSESFGHTGFVGTCVWADPRRDCTGVLLTNSVYFGRNDTRDLRAAFYEAMIEDLGLT